MLGECTDLQIKIPEEDANDKARIADDELSTINDWVTMQCVAITRGW